MARQRLALCLVVIEYPDFPADELRDPDSRTVIEANVPKRSHLHQRIRLYLADAALLSCLGQMLGVVGTRQNRGVVALPDVGILVRLGSDAVLALLLKDTWKP